VCPVCLFFSSIHTVPPYIYTLSLHDALPIYLINGLDDFGGRVGRDLDFVDRVRQPLHAIHAAACAGLPKVREVLSFLGVCRIVRSEEHTSELQSLRHLVCRLLLEKKKKKIYY